MRFKFNFFRNIKTYKKLNNIYKKLKLYYKRNNNN